MAYADLHFNTLFMQLHETPSTVLSILLTLR